MCETIRTLITLLYASFLGREKVRRTLNFFYCKTWEPKMRKKKFQAAFRILFCCFKSRFKVKFIVVGSANNKKINFLLGIVVSCSKTRIYVLELSDLYYMVVETRSLCYPMKQNICRFVYFFKVRDKVEAERRFFLIILGIDEDKNFIRMIYF